MAIHKTGRDRFVISSHGCWLPGVYADERAARYAFRFTDQELADLGKIYRVDGENRSVTFGDLQQLRRASMEQDQ